MCLILHSLTVNLRSHIVCNCTRFLHKFEFSFLFNMSKTLEVINTAKRFFIVKYPNFWVILMFRNVSKTSYKYLFTSVRTNNRNRSPNFMKFGLCNNVSKGSRQIGSETQEKGLALRACIKLHSEEGFCILAQCSAQAIALFSFVWQDYTFQLTQN